MWREHIALSDQLGLWLAGALWLLLLVLLLIRLLIRLLAGWQGASCLLAASASCCGVLGLLGLRDTGGGVLRMDMGSYEPWGVYMRDAEHATAHLCRAGVGSTLLQIAGFLKRQSVQCYCRVPSASLHAQAAQQHGCNAHEARRSAAVAAFLPGTEEDSQRRPGRDFGQLGHEGRGSCDGGLSLSFSGTKITSHLTTRQLACI